MERDSTLSKKTKHISVMKSDNCNVFKKQGKEALVYFY